jgi:signal peptidase
VLKKIKILSKALEWAVFVVLLGILGLVVSPYLPFKNVPKSFVVVSGSMEPTIHTGSVAFVKPVSPSAVKKGDIIAFTSPSNSKDTILHRVDSISSTDPLLFKTKGDNNNAPDLWDVMGVGVKGVYFGAIPYLGNAAAFVRQPLGFSLIIILPAVLFIISQILNIKKTISEEIEKGVTKKLKEKSKAKSKEKSVVNKIIIFLLLIQALVAFGFRQTILALYTDKATVTGISVSTGTWDTDPAPLHSLSVSSALQSEESETTPTPSPTDTPTATPEATDSASLTASPTPIPTEEPTATPGVTPTPSNSPTDAPTSTPESSPTG